MLEMLKSLNTLHQREEEDEEEEEEISQGRKEGRKEEIHSSSVQEGMV